MSSQGAITSLVYSSGAVVTAASMGYVFGRPTKKKKNNKITQLSNFSMEYFNSNNNNNNNNDMSISPSSTTSTLSSTVTSPTPKSPLKRFKLFRSKSKRSKVSSSKYVHPTTTVVHPHMVHPDQLVDDDTSSICSDITSVYTVNDRDRRTMSVPNLPVTLQQPQSWDNSPSMSITSGVGPYIHHSINETLHEEDEEDFENWDGDDGDSGFNEPLSKIAGTSSPSLPLSAPPPLKRHSRCKSLPPINVQDFSPSLFRRQPTPSEIWDDDFELDGNNELNVPSLVEETQFSLRMDISNIRDFVSQIEELKSLVEEKEKLSVTIQSKVTKKWTNGFLRRTASKKAKQLENVFKKDWEEAAVIIDIADFAENNENNEETVEGDRRVEVGIEHIPSERHMEVLKKIVVEGLGEDAKELVLFDDDDKENQCDNNDDNNNSNPSKKQKLIPFFLRNDHSDDDNESDSDKKRRRRKNFRVSVEVMPSLVDHLKKLRGRLDIHVKELRKLAYGTI